MINISIKKAAAEDAENLTAIQKQAFERLYNIYHDEANPYLRGSDEIKYQIEHGTRDIYKIFADDTLCGGISVRDKNGGEYYLNRIYILPQLQGKSIGRKAIELCEKYYPDAKRWTVDFPADQIANKKCYESCGYYDTGLREIISDKLTLAFYEKAVNGIFEIRQSQLDLAAEVIRSSFATVAKEFNITKENFPNHTSFMTTEKLQNNFTWGWLIFGLYEKEKLVGYVALSKQNDGVYELHNLAVLPDFRHKNYGRQLIDFCKSKVKELGGNKITLGMIEENTVLKNWYISNGFVHTGTKKFDNWSFTAGFMEWEE